MTDKQQTNTALPYTLSHENDANQNPITIVRDNKGYEVAFLSHPDYDGTQESSAEFIVRACNSYYKLLKLLKHAERDALACGDVNLAREYQLAIAEARPREA